MKKLKIPQATKQGYIECPAGGVFDWNYPNSRTRRGRVQDNGTICPTITAEGAESILLFEREEEK